MEAPFQPFTRLLRLMVPLTPSDEALVTQFFEPVAHRKGDVLTEIGRVATHMYYINTGFLRAYHRQDGTEVTNHLGRPNSFIAAYLSFTTQTPADESVVALTDCALLRVTKDNLDRLYRLSHNLAVFGILMADQYLIFNNQRSRDLITLSAEQRYRKLLQETPALVQHIPLQYIASYIGVKPESLSRIRRHLIS